MADHTEKKHKTDEDAIKYTLYSYWRSSCSWRVRIALNIKGLAYDYVPVHLLKEGGQQLKEDYVKLNASKTVPTLMVGDAPLGQSGAIISFLEEAHPTPSLLPKDVFLRAKARQLSDIVCCDTQPVQNLRVLKMVATMGGEEKKTEWARYWIEQGLVAMEREVQSTAGLYCVGDSVTIADCALIPQLYNARRFACNMEQFPTLTRIEGELNKLEAVQRAHADRQPDAEK